MSVDPVVYHDGEVAKVRRLSSIAGAELADTDPIVYYLGAVARLSETGADFADTDPIAVKGGRVRRLSRFPGETLELPPPPPPPPPPTLVTWNAADAGPNIVVSGADLLTASGGAAWNSVRATVSRDVTSVGRYFEALAVSGMGSFGTAIGLCDIAESMNANILNDTHGCGYFANVICYNGGTTAAGLLADGNVVGVAVKNGVAWFAKDGVWQNGDPAALTGGQATAIDPAATFPGFSDAVGGVMTANFGATAFAHAAPAGFLAWNA